VPRSTPRRTPSRSPAAPPPLPGPLVRPEDAIDVLLLAASHPPRTEAIALVLDRAHCGLTCMIVDGAHPAELPTLAEVLLQAAAERRHVGAFVLATTAAEACWPGATDELLWRQLRERFETQGYELLDWFVLVDGLAVSMAEITDSRPLWLAGG
jgi:hypothetical protein